MYVCVYVNIHHNIYIRTHTDIYIHNYIYTLCHVQCVQWGLCHNFTFNNCIQHATIKLCIPRLIVIAFYNHRLYIPISSWFIEGVSRIQCKWQDTLRSFCASPHSTTRRWIVSAGKRSRCVLFGNNISRCKNSPHWSPRPRTRRSRTSAPGSLSLSIYIYIYIYMYIHKYNYIYVYIYIYTYM